MNLLEEQENNTFELSVSNAKKHTELLPNTISDESWKELSEEILISLIVQGKAIQYNPVYIYGKSYDIEGFSERLQSRLDEKKADRVCALQGDSFVKQLIKSYIGGFKDEFRKRIRNADILIFTSIEEIQGKNACMEEFYSLFDYYYERQRMIIIGSSLPANQLTKLAERVYTQISSGLIVPWRREKNN